MGMVDYQVVARNAIKKIGFDHSDKVFIFKSFSMNDRERH
jgi:hypothetical protein